MVMRLVRDDQGGQQPRPRPRVGILSRPRGGGPRLVRDSINAPAGAVETVEGTMASEVSEEVELSAPAPGAGEADAEQHALREAAREADRAAEGERPDGSVEHGREGEDADGSDQGTSEAVAANLGAMEALLLSTHHPLTAGRLAELLDLDATRPIRKAIQELNEQYASTGRCFRIEQVAGGYQILTLPEYGDVLKKLHQKEGDARLTKAALETLAIVAYKQPILRADIEAIRGVACGETVRSLMEKHLVKIAGRAEEPGRPILYGTTKRFLELFGLNSLKDLPQPENANKPTLSPSPQQESAATPGE
jgi:segregation and condensation protein B